MRNYDPSQMCATRSKQDHKRKGQGVRSTQDRRHQFQARARDPYKIAIVLAGEVGIRGETNDQ